MKGKCLRCLFTMCCLLLMPIYGVVAAEDADFTASPPLLGDVDGDGEITPTDARLLLQFSTHKCIPFPGTPEYELYEMWRLRLADCADVDGDKAITTTDARLILQYYAGKITEWPKTNCEGGLLPNPPYMAVVTDLGDGTVQYTAYKGTLGVRLADATTLQLTLMDWYEKTPYTGAVSWSSTVPDVASVDENGLVTLHGAGNTRIYALYTEDQHIELRLLVS